MVISPELLEILACPKCKGALTATESPEGFICSECRLLFKTEDDIPNFLIDEAEPIDSKSVQK